MLDSLRFVMESLQTSLDHAIKSRGGITEVRRRHSGHPHAFAIQLELEIEGERFDYGFEIEAKKQGGFAVRQETLSSRAASYRVSDGKLVHASSGTMPPVAGDRLYLVNAAGLPEFRGVYDHLLAMGVLQPEPASDEAATDR